MTAKLSCWRCGTSLVEVPLPLSRREECPKCRAELHVCRMCVHYAPRLLRACDEDDAPDVRDKQTANFCDYYRPSASAFDASKADADAAARAELAKLFAEPAAGRSAEEHAPSGEHAATGGAQPASDPLSDAEALFKR